MTGTGRYLGNTYTTTINSFSVVAWNALYNNCSDVDALQAVVQKRYPSRRPPPSPTCMHILMQSVQTWCVVRVLVRACLFMCLVGTSDQGSSRPNPFILRTCMYKKKIKKIIYKRTHKTKEIHLPNDWRVSYWWDLSPEDSSGSHAIRGERRDGSYAWVMLLYIGR